MEVDDDEDDDYDYGPDEQNEFGVEANERYEAERFMKETEKAKDRRRNKYA